LSIDYETVRSHVRELRARTNTRRQADLVRVLLFAWLIGCPVNDR
jgi:DNA-binding CsgD family transcriptional regulator